MLWGKNPFLLRSAEGGRLRPASLSDFDKDLSISTLDSVPNSLYLKCQKGPHTHTYTHPIGLSGTYMEMPGHFPGDRFFLLKSLQHLH